MKSKKTEVTTTHLDISKLDGNYSVSKVASYIIEGRKERDNELENAKNYCEQLAKRISDYQKDNDDIDFNELCELARNIAFSFGGALTKNEKMWEVGKLLGI